MRAVIEPLLLTAARISTFDGPRLLTGASGFFFEREGRLYVVTSRHVLVDQPTRHFPDRIELELHDDAGNLASSSPFSIALYRDGQSVWAAGADSGGEVDVAVLRIQRDQLPTGALLHAFTPRHLVHAYDEVEVGTAIRIVGFPLGFHDTLHHLPVVRQSAIASSFGLRFQGQGFFLTDGRTHRGTSGAPVVMRDASPAPRPVRGRRSAGAAALPWRLLGVHSARLDMGNRDRVQDESLGLNCAWYADILLALTTA